MDKSEQIGLGVGSVVCAAVGIGLLAAASRFQGRKVTVVYACGGTLLATSLAMSLAIGVDAAIKRRQLVKTDPAPSPKRKPVRFEIDDQLAQKQLSEEQVAKHFGNAETLVEYAEWNEVPSKARLVIHDTSTDTRYWFDLRCSGTRQYLLEKGVHPYLGAADAKGVRIPEKIIQIIRERVAQL